MKTFTDIIQLVQQNNLVNRCVGVDSTSTDKLNSYIDAQSIQQRIDRIIFTNSFRKNVICNIFYITHDTTSDKFLFYKNVFHKSELSVWAWQKEACELEWIKTENNVYSIVQKDIPVYEVFKNQIPKIVYKSDV